MDVAPSCVLGECKKDIEYIVRPGAYALIMKEVDGQTLVGLIKIEDELSKKEKYYLVGGGIEDCDNNDYTSALKREILEETGYSAIDEEFITRMDEYFFSPHMNGHFKKEGYFYQIVLEKKQCEPLETTHELVWYLPETAFEKVHHLCAKKLIETLL